MTDSVRIFQGDCFEHFGKIDDGSIDLVLVDPPYGTTQSAWDSCLPPDRMWAELNRVSKPSAAMLFFSAQPFTTELIASNRANFRYDIIWRKTIATGHLNANKKPMRAHEIIVVFYRESPSYTPQMSKGEFNRVSYPNPNKSRVYGSETNKPKLHESSQRHPTSVIEFSSVAKHVGRYHPNQKPVPLLEYLIRTYSDEGETVLDFTMGSGSTGVAAMRTKRRFVGFELDGDFFEIARKRIGEARSQLVMFA